MSAISPPYCDGLNLPIALSSFRTVPISVPALVSTTKPSRSKMSNPSAVMSGSSRNFWNSTVPGPPSAFISLADHALSSPGRHLCCTTVGPSWAGACVNKKFASYSGAQSFSKQTVTVLPFKLTDDIAAFSGKETSYFLCLVTGCKHFGHVPLSRKNTAGNFTSCSCPSASQPTSRTAGDSNLAEVNIGSFGRSITFITFRIFAGVSITMAKLRCSPLLWTKCRLESLDCRMPGGMHKGLT
eukprot:5676375-Amphidinium_carterae.2